MRLMTFPNDVRVYYINNQVWFALKDVLSAVGFSGSIAEVINHVKSVLGKWHMCFSHQVNGSCGKPIMLINAVAVHVLMGYLSSPKSQSFMDWAYKVAADLTREALLNAHKTDQDHLEKCTKTLSELPPDLVETAITQPENRTESIPFHKPISDAYLACQTYPYTSH